jgi:formamidopyrimidine-DNA glycosylase
MPELPEVEFARRSLEKWFEGHKLVRTEAESGVRTFRDCDLGIFKSLKGSLLGIDRKGKYLMVRFSNKLGFVGHLGMTGKFLKRAPGEEVKWSRARFFLDSGEVIHFQDMRMFGRIDAVPATELEGRPGVAKLGLDPLRDGLSVEQLQAALDGSNQELKVALMDQERIAGLGNIHAAEALFRSKLHPERAAASLTPAEWKALTRGIQASIDFALEHEGEGDEIEYVEEGAPNPFLVYGRAGTPCRRCKTIVKSFTQAGRTTHFCPTCQPKVRKTDGDQLRKRPRARRYRG